MKVVTWTLCLLAACVCFTEARYKFRRPTMPQQPPQIFKKSWPIAHRMSMGNTVHIGGNYGHKRPHYKPANYRIRRPPMYNILPTAWKNKVPVLNTMNNHAVLPQRPPVKEFHSMNKVPEYSPEYRPETAVMPPTHRGGMDDDKGAIHTIPAPNLSLADKPYNLIDSTSENNPESQVSRHQYPNDSPYNGNHPATNFAFGTLVTSAASQRPQTSPAPTQNQYEVTESNEIGTREYHTVQPTFFTPEFDSGRLSTPPNLDLQSNELYLNHPGPSNVLNPSQIGTNIQFGQSNTPLQTNLHSSLHVGFPGSAAQAPSSLGQQVPDLHVGHPVPAGPPLSATQLYDLLNSFPQQVSEQYASGQQPQLQQHILQQQLGQLFQPTGGVTSFSQPQMHSFNYDEQANKLLRQQQQQQQQQQQIIVEQDYGSGRVTADYNLEPEAAGNVQSPSFHANVNGNNEEINYRAAEPSDQAENHIEYEESSNQRGQNTYFSKVGNEGSISTQFYTTLPNKDAAEKLAALAAAGNVNSHLIGQLRKQQQQQQQQQQVDEEDVQQNDDPVPLNHKDSAYEVNESLDDDVPYDAQQQRYNDQQQEQYDEQQQRYDDQQQRYNDQQQRYDDQQQRYDEQQKQYDQQQYNRQNYRQQQQIRQQQENNDRYEQQRFNQHQRHQQQQQMQSDQPEENSKRPMRIMVPDVEEYAEENNSQRTSVETENTSEDYDYENPQSENGSTRTTASSESKTTYEQNPTSEFGARLSAKKGQ